MFGSIANPQTLNRYAYTLNNPLSNVDPTGHEPTSFYGCDYYDDEAQQEAHDPAQRRDDAQAQPSRLPPAIIPAAIIATITPEAAAVALAVVTNAISRAALGTTINIGGGEDTSGEPRGGSVPTGVSHTGNVTPADLLIFAPIEVRPKDIQTNEMNNVDAQNNQAYPQGKSAFADLGKAPLHGRYLLCRLELTSRRMVGVQNDRTALTQKVTTQFTPL
jgi:hypothetical protein